MTKKERADYILHHLEELYPETPIPLDHVDPYTLLVAVLLSAQCTDARVNTVTPALFERASNPHDMMRVPVAEVLAIVKPCGLAPKKAAAIVGLSKILVEQHDGEVPADLAALELLPGLEFLGQSGAWRGLRCGALCGGMAAGNEGQCASQDKCMDCPLLHTDPHSYDPIWIVVPCLVLTHLL